MNRPHYADRRRIYSDLGLEELPRFLSTMDRNEFSRTYGCCNREFWLTRVMDFPSAIAQFGVHGLALAWGHDMPGNPFRGHPKVLAWIRAGMGYLTRIQHGDGSFDEFYPNERGWAGPTGFLVHAMIGCYRLVGRHMTPEERARFLDCMRRAARFLGKNDEVGVLANHHAMAALPVAETADLLGDDELWALYGDRMDELMRHCHEEGWCLEYDGADPGYLSATVSFLAKLYRVRPEERIEQVIRRAIPFCSYFITPDGHYGGTLGSRQTLHFYPHGMELWAGRVPLAAAMADRMLDAFWQGASVWPGLQEERYFVYRIPEFLQSYLDFGPRPAAAQLLPYEWEPFVIRFEGAGIQARRLPWGYLVVNLARGGVVKLFAMPEGRPLLVDSGVVGELADGTVFTSQWVDPGYEREQGGDVLRVAGRCHKVPSQVFTPLKMIGFRSAMLSTGWNARIAKEAKGLIRAVLMTQAKPAPVSFERTIALEAGGMVVTDSLSLAPGARVLRLKVGDDIPLRYVPQSRYFQPQELEVEGIDLGEAPLGRLNREGRLCLRRRVLASQGRVELMEGFA
ncbi:MAG: hypothetical protein RBU30_07290 [Polyangia bacterium]|jgi:hypothetical protein|nr:hypothetical protein [Polyangia bacterium]